MNRALAPIKFHTTKKLNAEVKATLNDQSDAPEIVEGLSDSTQLGPPKMTPHQWWLHVDTSMFGFPRWSPALIVL